MLIGTDTNARGCAQGISQCAHGPKAVSRSSDHRDPLVRLYQRLGNRFDLADARNRGQGTVS
jgi:hypothetical protein